MRIAVSAVVFVLALLVGAKTQWVAVSSAAVRTDADRTAEDRAIAAVVLGETSPDATSAELIDAAVSRGDISPERGLLYGVYLACDPAQLPAEYRGANEAAVTPDILSEADVDWASLSTDTQQALSAFLSAQFSAEADGTCAGEVRRLAGEPDVWWTAALGNGPDPDDATQTASRP